MANTSITISFDTYRAIEALVYEHAWRVDNGEADKLYELYTEDGKLIGIGPDRVGRAAIAAYGESRVQLTERVTRHLCNNLRLIPIDSGTVKGTVIATLFRYDGDVSDNATPIAVGEYTDTFVRESSGEWRFSERRLRIIFESPEHRT